MNLVEMVMKSLGGDVATKLASVLNAGETETKQAVGAAVPAMLSGLGSLASSPKGGEKLWSAVQDVDDNIVGNLSEMLAGGQQDAISKMGSGLLKGLFGDGIVNSLVSVLGKFLGGKSALIAKLLPMLAPMVLGTIAKQVKSSGLSLDGLTKLFAGQKENIAKAMPVGLMDSLSSAQGLGDLSGFAQSASVQVGTPQRTGQTVATETASPLRWLLPLIGILAVAAVIYWWVNRPEREVPGVQDAKDKVEETVDQVSNLAIDFDDYFANMGTTFSGITDVDSAKAAVPKLEDMNTQLDSLGEMFGALPAASRPALAKTIESATSKLEEERQRIEGIPGVGDIVKSILDRIFEKLMALVKP
jgi:hypothetical protein